MKKHNMYAVCLHLFNDNVQTVSIHLCILTVFNACNDQLHKEYVHCLNFCVILMSRLSIKTFHNHIIISKIHQQSKSMQVHNLLVGLESCIKGHNISKLSIVQLCNRISPKHSG